MIHRLIGLAVVVVVIIIGLTMYLAPDDLAKCSGPGSGECAMADAIVAVSGGDTDARTDEAIRLYKQKWSSLLIMSGAAADKTGLSNAEAMKRRALSQGVPDKNIIIEDHSETTKQNAVEVKSVITARKMKRIILVTSGYHMQRARSELAAQVPGVEVLSHQVRRDKHWGDLWWLTPWGWWLAVGELIKIGLFTIGGTR